MKKALLFSCLLAISIIFSCNSDDSSSNAEEEPTLNGTWVLTKIIDRSGNDLTTNCNIQDNIVVNENLEFIETRHKIDANQKCVIKFTFRHTSVKHCQLTYKILSKYSVSKSSSLAKSISIIF